MSDPVRIPPRVPDKPRIPDEASERRLFEIRREDESKGIVKGAGVRPAGAPFPMASVETGYYGIPLLKEPSWTWEIPLYFFVGGAAGSAAVVGAIANYTGVLIGASAIPVWNKNVGNLPIHFGMSGLSATVGLLELMGSHRSRALQMLGLGAALWECWEGFHLESRREPALDPLRHGASGT